VSGPERVEAREAEAPSAPPRPLRLVARLGLVARGLFYLLLAGLAAQLALGSRSGPAQANANGALTQVAGAPLGIALLAGAALGFLAFALVRVYGAITDGRHGGWRRLGTAGQGLIYVGMALVTASFLLGRRSTGSEQQQRSTAQSIIMWPFGRGLLVAAGLVVLAMCGWQLLVVARGDFADSLRNGRLHRLTLMTARIGIPARALAVAPVGVFLVVAAVQADPQQAKGLDAVLLDTSRTPVGRVLVLLAAAGFVVFAVYSLLEARYRELASGA
jgi:hypothetical protein